MFYLKGKNANGIFYAKLPKMHKNGGKSSEKGGIPPFNDVTYSLCSFN